MKAFAGVLRFEVRYHLRRISTWVYVAVFFAIAFLLLNAIGGAWESVNMAVGGSSGTVHVNSPYVLTALGSVLSLFSVLVTAGLLGNAVYRDYETGIAPLFFTTPISKIAYLGGRFSGALLTNALILLSIPLGMMLGSVMPYLDAQRFGPFELSAFFDAYLVIMLPNLLLTGAIFFALAALTRQMMPNYLGGAVMLVGYLLSSNLTQDLEFRRLAALLDPFGMTAFEYVTQYWTPAERNTRLLPMRDVFLYNRLLWVTVGLVIAGLVGWRFRFAHATGEARWWWRKRSRTAAGETAAPVAGPRTVPRFDLSFSAAARLQQYLSVTRRSFWSIVGNRYFFAILGCGLLFLVFSASQAGTLYGTTTWPVTYEVIELLGGTFTIFVLIIITFYTGDLVWQERDAGLNQVHDALPLPTWVPLAAKFTALTLMLVVLQVVTLVAGVLTQAFKGYTNFEPGLYARTLFGLYMADYVLLAALVLLVQVIVNHKYMGHLIVVTYFVLTMIMDALGFEHGLYQYGSDAGMTYSDMNRYGPFLRPFWWFKAYWAGWALLFAVVASLFWVRGQESGVRRRVEMARMRARRSHLAVATLAVLLIAGAGGFVFYNTNVLNTYRTSYDDERDAAEYERAYKQYEPLPQPRIMGVRVDVDLFPAEQRIAARGEYQLENRTSELVRAVHLRIPREIDIRAITFDRSARRTHEDARRGYYIYTLDAPLEPGQTSKLTFDLATTPRGFKNQVSNTQVVENGTFFHNDILPALGYDPSRELAEDQARRKYGLAPKERMPSLDEKEAARRNNYLRSDSDWVTFETTVSTVPDQVAIAPGYLQREWTDGIRRYFHYRMDAPILNLFAFLSARYEVRRDRWQGPGGEDVAIEIYYHPGHEYNLDRMIDAVKKSLTYFTESFGPYQHRQVRILEFPRYRQFAQSLPNTIPYSEAIGFIARLEDPEDIDYPFYVTAHEVAHQWWAHQVMGANVQGATVLSETLSQYSALMVMEREYGAGQMRRFLRYELDNYLGGRAFEQKKELPLLRVENQGYIHYNKGSLAMYALRDYIGEKPLNAALARFVADKKYQQTPYPTSRDLLAYLRAATPVEQQPVLEDLFEHITLFDNRATAATAAKTADGMFRVSIDIEAKKYRADDQGNEREVAMSDDIDVGVFAEPEDGRSEGAPLYLAKHRISAGAQRIEVVVNRAPARAGIDPYHKLIDRVTRDNTVAVTGLD